MKPGSCLSCKILITGGLILGSWQHCRPQLALADVDVGPLFAVGAALLIALVLTLVPGSG